MISVCGISHLTVVHDDNRKNLKHTYSDDVMFCSKIDTFLQIIDAKIIELQGKYYILFQDEDDDDNASGNSNETLVTRLDNSE